MTNVNAVAEEVAVATTALNLAELTSSFFDEGIFSESEGSKEEDMYI